MKVLRRIKFFAAQAQTPSPAENQALKDTQTSNSSQSSSGISIPPPPTDSGRDTIDGGSLAKEMRMTKQYEQRLRSFSDRPIGVTYVDSPKNKRLPVSREDMKKAETDGVVQKHPSGDWGIISKRKGLWWSTTYDSREKAEAALRAYHAGKH